MTKSRLGGKGLISPVPPANSPSLREFKARTCRQELMEKPWLTGLLSYGLLGLLSYSIQITSPQVALPT